MILAFAIVGPFALSAQSLRAARDARFEITANYLALEGLEIMHSIRDNNSADDMTPDHSRWLDNILTPSSPNCLSGCVPDITKQQSPNVWGTEALVRCDPPGCVDRGVVYFNTNTGLYTNCDSILPAPWQKTKFTRVLTVTQINPYEVRITSTVTYLGYGRKTRSLSLTEDLYNWFPPLQ
jgi:hypothetical protein